MHAVKKGPMAMVTNTLATVVSVSATMKAVNITLQQIPLTHSGQPPWRSLANTRGPPNSGRMTNRESAVNRLRQKVTSKLRAASRLRVTTPAVDHIKATATMTKTARVWVKRNAIQD